MSPALAGGFLTTSATWEAQHSFKRPLNQFNFGWESMAPHSSTLAWKIPWMEESGRLRSMGSLSLTRLSDFTFTFHFHALEKEMATHSSVLAWRIPGTGSLWADVYGVAQSQTRLKCLSSSRVGVGCEGGGMKKKAFRAEKSMNKGI